MAELTYELTDVEERAEKNPDFWFPPKLLRRNLKVGKYVQLVFNSVKGQPPGAERMWVMVIEILNDGFYKGELHSDPVSIKILHGEKVLFESRHVCAIE